MIWSPTFAPDHPGDQDLPPGTPVDHPSDQDLSPGTPAGAKMGHGSCGSSSSGELTEDPKKQARKQRGGRHGEDPSGGDVAHGAPAQATPICRHGAGHAGANDV